jgi:hypothetical protein
MYSKKINFRRKCDFTTTINAVYQGITSGLNGTLYLISLHLHRVLLKLVYCIRKCIRCRMLVSCSLVCFCNCISLVYRRYLRSSDVTTYSNIRNFWMYAVASKFLAWSHILNPATLRSPQTQGTFKIHTHFCQYSYICSKHLQMSPHPMQSKATCFSAASLK